MTGSNLFSYIIGQVFIIIEMKESNQQILQCSVSSSQNLIIYFIVITVFASNVPRFTATLKITSYVVKISMPLLSVAGPPKIIQSDNV